MRGKPILMFLGCLTLSSMQSCAETKQAVPDACGWLEHFTPDPGFEHRWTRREKEHQVAENRNIDKNCHG